MKFQGVKTSQGWFKLNNVEAVQNFLSNFDVDEPLAFDIDKPKKPRNLSQNAKLHAMFMDIDKVNGNNDPARTKWEVLIELGFYEEFEIKGRLEKLPRSTSKLEKKAFAELIDRVCKWAWEFWQLDLRSIEDRGY